MIKVKCNNREYIGDGEFEYCGYELEKPKWEHIVNTMFRQGGHAGKNICPKIFDFGESK